VRKDGISRSNMRFQITETDCSTLGEDASVRDRQDFAVQVRTGIVRSAASGNCSPGQ
jgi:hypothetical protein